MRRLLSVSLCSGLLTLIKMASGFVVAKAVAVYAGPGGIALLGQFQSMVLALNTAVASPISNGLIRYTAENNEAGIKACAPWWKAATRWLVGLLVVIALVCLACASPLAGWLLNDSGLAWLILIAVASLPLSALFALVTAVLNGQQRYKPYFLFSAIGVIGSTAIILTLVIVNGTTGGLFATALGSAFSGLVVLLSIRKEHWFKWRYWWGKTDKNQLLDIGKYVLMGLSSAIFMPVALIFIRKILVLNTGWNQAGQWQAVYKISEVYLGVITIAISTYCLPRLAALSDRKEIRREIFSTAKVIMPLVVISALGIYLLRDIAIGLLFTEAFRNSRELFAVQLIGDVFKIMGWLFAYTMWSHGAVLWFIASECMFCLAFVGSAWLLTGIYGTEGANIAYAASYAVYFVLMVVRLQFARI